MKFSKRLNGKIMANMTIKYAIDKVDLALVVAKLGGYKGLTRGQIISQLRGDLGRSMHSFETERWDDYGPEERRRCIKIVEELFPEVVK